MDRQLSVVMPAYNEEALIEDVLDRLRTKVMDRFEEAEVVVVNDASTDDTGKILDALAVEDPRVMVTHLAHNKGHGFALRQGLELVRGDWIFQLDSDDPIDAEEFWSLWSRKPSRGLVMGVRTKRRASWFRRSITATLKGMTRSLGVNLQDPNVPFKVFSRDVWDDLKPAMGSMSSVPSAFISVGAVVKGHEVVEIPVRFHAREEGRSIGALKVALTSMKAGWELGRFYLRLRRR